MWFERLTAILAVVMQVVALIEKAMKGKPGPEKKAVAQQVINESMSNAGVGQTGKTQDVVSETIDNVVDVFNRAGVFRKSEAKGKSKK